MVKNIATALLIGLLSYGNYSAAQTVDLREYFPARLNIYNRADGVEYRRYNFYYAQQTKSDNHGYLYLTYFNLGLNQPDSKLLVWQKVYGSCYKTYAHLILGGGSDRRVQEVGDWYDFGPPGQPGQCSGAYGSGNYDVLGYRHGYRNLIPTGLFWSGPGGLDSSFQSYVVASVFTGKYNYGDSSIDALSSTGLIQKLDTFSPRYGRDANHNWVANPAKIYTDVVKMVFYHGTTQGPKAACGPRDPTNPYAAYYYHWNGYSSWALEVYLDKKHGIIQETSLYAEDTSLNGQPCGFYPTLVSSPSLEAALFENAVYIDVPFYD